MGIVHSKVIYAVYVSSLLSSCKLKFCKFILETPSYLRLQQYCKKPD